MSGPWRVRFVDISVIKAFGKPRRPETRLKAQASLGYVPWPFFGIQGGQERAGVDAHCPYCGRVGSVPLVGEDAWEWNGDADMPTLSPSLQMSGGPEGCGFHCFVRNGEIIDAGTPPHREVRP